MSHPPEEMKRLVDRRDLDGVEAELAADVGAAAAVLARTRLAPDAVDRIETELDRLEAAGAIDPLFRFARGALLVAATAALVLVAWSRSPAARTSARPMVAARAPSRPLHLDRGSLAVVTDDDTITVETPNARIEIAPQSRVNIVVFESNVRIAASSGSARIVYYDGRTELVTPLVAPAKPAPHAPKRAHPVAHESSLLDPESQSYERALARVRPAPAEALTLLDAFVKAYPEGLHHGDAERVIVALLLRLDRKADARAALERMAALPPELRVVRAEMRYDAGRPEEAVADFGAVLVSGDVQFRARALFGRALAWKRLGDEAHAVDDLDQLLLVAPRGELADRARAELARTTR